MKLVAWKILNSPIFSIGTLMLMLIVYIFVVGGLQPHKPSKNWAGDAVGGVIIRKIENSGKSEWNIWFLRCR